MNTLPLHPSGQAMLERPTANRQAACCAGEIGKAERLQDRNARWAWILQTKVGQVVRQRAASDSSNLTGRMLQEADFTRERRFPDIL